MAELELVRSDYGYDLEFSILDASSNAVDLTNSTVKFKVKKYGATALTIDAACNRTVPYTLGIVTYTVQQTDFTAIGKYKGEIEITWTGGKVMTATDLEISIVADLVGA